MASLQDIWAAYQEEQEKQASDASAEVTTEVAASEPEIDEETKEALDKFAEAEVMGRIAARAYLETLNEVFSSVEE